MDLLWSILPDKIVRIFLEQIECFDRPRTMVEYLDTQKDFFTSLIAIDWHDKTEITRPVNYEDMIGCVGWFWDDSEADDTSPCLGVLTAIAGGEYYTQVETWGFDNFRPAKKSELKFYGD
jgi:hypothetical protein